MSDLLDELAERYGDEAAEDLMRLYSTELQASNPAEIPRIVGNLLRPPSQRQLRALRESVVTGPTGAYARGYRAGYGK